MIGFSSLKLVLSAWSAVTLVLIGLIIHRSILGFRESDRIFLEDAGRILQEEQNDTLQRVAHVDLWIGRLLWLSGGMLLLVIAFWLYPGLAPLIAD